VTKSKILTAATAVLAGGVLAVPAQGQAPRAPVQTVTGPVSTYWMSAETSAGFGAGLMGGGGGGQAPSLGAIMGMMGGGGAPAASRRLTLQLGSSRTNPAPAADHTPPAGLGVESRLPLVTPVRPPTAPVQHEDDEPAEIPREYQRPRGRMLIFWGCGEQTRPGQPLVLDFAQLTAGKAPPAALAAMKGLNYTPMRPPSPGRHATYGEWPNERSSRQPTTGSLTGPHSVAGNYSSPISFMLTPDKDFLPALGLRTGKTASGGAMLTWTASAPVRAYVATAVGGGNEDTVALWISSETQAAGFGLPDYLTPGDITRLVGQKALMAPGTASCALPRAFVDAAPTAIVTLVGYGDEANFSHPPRPADPRTPWNIDWTAKVRYRTSDSAILGMDMGAMTGGGMMGGAAAPAPPASPAARGFPGQPAQAPARGFPGQPAAGFPGQAPPPAQGAPPTGAARDAIIRGLGSAILGF
jgi:hypothetical protein